LRSQLSFAADNRRYPVVLKILCRPEGLKNQGLRRYPDLKASRLLLGDSRRLNGKRKRFRKGTVPITAKCSLKQGL